MNKLAEFEPGAVWLAGAGPGDPGLITLHCLHGLQTCDVVVYDALASEEILDLTRDGVERIYAGKRGGRPSATQIDISRRLIELSRQGKRVLRLKGGDPFMFGRGGEEALALVEAGVSFRIIPGITAGLGGLAYAGIPATHRDVNSAITFVTGHALTGAVPEGLNWQALADGGQVLVFYMAMKHLGEIVGSLLEAGVRRDMPCAIVSDASTPDMRVCEASLAELCAASARSEMRAPAIVVVGETVTLRRGLDWLGAAQAGRTLDANPLGSGVPEVVRHAG